MMERIFIEFDSCNDGAISVPSVADPLDDEFELGNSLANKTLVDPPLLPCNPSNDDLALRESHGGAFKDEVDFSDVVLRYINQILMEEDEDTADDPRMFQEPSLALQDAEKSFYEVLGENYPPPPNPQLASVLDDHSEIPGENPKEHHSECSKHRCSCSFSEHRVNHGKAVAISEISNESDFISHFERGVEEGNMFLPSDFDLRVSPRNSGSSCKGPNKEAKSVQRDLHGNVWPSDRSRGRKTPHCEDVDLVCGRSAKQLAVYTESTLRSAMFDKILLSDSEEGESALREDLRNRASKNTQQNIEPRGSNGKKTGRTKTVGKRGPVDLRGLLSLCAQAVAASDRKSAENLLWQARQHFSRTGDGIQRLAAYFADALKARLDGTGSQSYTTLLLKPMPATIFLRCHYVFLAVCPFVKILYFFSNKTIMRAAEKASRLHVIDFGIYYGFQWPSFIEQLSSRPGGPPRLRITGIDLPRPGKRPAERIEETGQRLADYAESFNVPFEFNSIAQKWEAIRLEDIKIESGEVLVVNSILRFRHLHDEGLVLKSPRNAVLDLIKKMNPSVYIQADANAALCVPFFLSRFQEAIFYYSALFDMIENVIPRETPERMAVEELLGCEILNAIACEGFQRIERPETYKQWRAQIEKAGFRQLPLSKELLRMAKERVGSVYHKDFLIEEDGHWLLQGWKGRITNALSCWKPIN